MRIVVAAGFMLFGAGYCTAQNNIAPASPAPVVNSTTSAPSPSGEPGTEPVPQSQGAVQPEPPPSTKPARPPRTYTVWLWQETRDCLWTLSERFYGDPWLWKKIYLANKDQIEDPRIIYPKQVLVIPYPDE